MLTAPAGPENKETSVPGSPGCSSPGHFYD